MFCCQYTCLEAQSHCYFSNYSFIFFSIDFCMIIKVVPVPAKKYFHMKTIHRMGDNLCKLSNWQRINLQNAQTSYAALYHKNNPIKKWAEEQNRHFSKDWQTDGQKPHEKMLNITIREMQIKTTMRYYLTPVRIATIKKSTNNKCWRRCGEKGTLLPCWWECKLVQSLWRTERRIL